MTPEVKSILRLRVPVIVRLGEKVMPLQDVMALGPGTIIEFPKLADEELDILVNNIAIGMGTAVKIGENFGLKVTDIGDPKDRIMALAGGMTQVQPKKTETAGVSQEEAEAMADQILAGL